MKEKRKKKIKKQTSYLCSINKVNSHDSMQFKTFIALMLIISSTFSNVSAPPVTSETFTVIKNPRILKTSICMRKLINPDCLIT